MALNLSEPAAAAPPGFVSDVNHPSATLEPVIVAISVIVLFITTVSVAARLIARCSVSRLTWEDYFLIMAWVANVGYIGVTLFEVAHGLGRYTWDVTLGGAQLVEKGTFALFSVYLVLVFCAKSAMLFQIMRTFAPTKKSPVYIIGQVQFWLNAGFYLAMLIAWQFQCVADPAGYDFTLVESSHCTNSNTLILVVSPFNVVSDLVLFVLPLWAIWQLKMTRKYKLGVMVIFGTGFITLVASIGRMAGIIQYLMNTDGALTGQTELWSLGEPTAIILCTCFPMMPRFLQVLNGEKSRSSSPTPGPSREPSLTAPKMGKVLTTVTSNSNLAADERRYLGRDAFRPLTPRSPVRPPVAHPAPAPTPENAIHMTQSIKMTHHPRQTPSPPPNYYEDKPLPTIRDPQEIPTVYPEWV